MASFKSLIISWEVVDDFILHEYTPTNENEKLLCFSQAPNYMLSVSPKSIPYMQSPQMMLDSSLFVIQPLSVEY